MFIGLYLSGLSPVRKVSERKMYTNPILISLEE
jgi:hypothetical protein